jgi:hypothetical protein
MQNTTLPPRDSLGISRDIHSSAVAWSAIIGGAVAALSLSLLLFILGSGLGLASLSGWMHTGPSAMTVTSVTVAWLIITQWISAGLGGYLAGRLRTRYVSIHTDEMFFRDTAHGFLAWAVATVVTAALFASSAISGIGSAGHMMMAGAGAAGFAHPGMERPMGSSPMGGPEEAHMYLVDSLFRPATTAQQPVGGPPSSIAPLPGADREVRAEANRIFLNGLKNGDVPAADKAYLSLLVASRTNITIQEAQNRVDDAVAQMKADEEQAKQAMEKARKTGATLSIFTFLALLVGAFIASVTGALGGKRRDEYAL